jgi:hypothetical protein
MNSIAPTGSNLATKCEVKRANNERQSGSDSELYKNWNDVSEAGEN